MVRTIDWFNEHLREVGGPLTLDSENIDFYQLYMAKKTGKPNDDFPSKREPILTCFSHRAPPECAEDQLPALRSLRRPERLAPKLRADVPRASEEGS